MNLTSIVAALVEAGATPALILAAVAAAEADREQALNIKRMKDAERKRRSRGVTVTSAESHGHGVTSRDNPAPLDAPLALSPNPLPTPPFNPPTIIPTSAPRRGRVSLAELSVNHVADWLAEKRSQGRYLQHDEHFVLEQFRNYCQSKGKKYADYVAGFRNAFEWERCRPKAAVGIPAKPTSWTSAGQQLAAKYAAEAEREEQAAAGHPPQPSLRIAENLRQDEG